MLQTTKETNEELNVCPPNICTNSCLEVNVQQFNPIDSHAKHLPLSKSCTRKILRIIHGLLNKYVCVLHAVLDETEQYNDVVPFNSHCRVRHRKTDS